jgi:RNA polymerase sigma factor (sigma-70 family)
MKNVTTMELYALFINGEFKAREELMKRCVKFLKQKVYNTRIACDDQKNELIQEVVLKVLENIERFTPRLDKPDGGFWGWVARISHNNFNEYGRKLKKHQNFLSIDETYDDSGESVIVIAHNHNWINETSDREMMKRIYLIVSRLPEKQMKVLKMKYKFNMSYTEIADKLNEKEANIRVYHARALDKIYNDLGETDRPYSMAA